MDVKTSEIEVLAETLIGSQKRADGSSNAHHAKRVRALVLAALETSGEAPQEPLRSAIAYAALAHDFLEDSSITKDELRDRIGDTALQLVETLTNTWGDGHADPYVAQVAAGSEEARLIKYADLIDNIFHVSFSASLLGKEWVHSYFLPIVDPMQQALATTTFAHYPTTALEMRNTATLARTHLQETIARL